MVCGQVAEEWKMKRMRFVYDEGKDHYGENCAAQAQHPSRLCKCQSDAVGKIRTCDGQGMLFEDTKELLQLPTNLLELGHVPMNPGFPIWRKTAIVAQLISICSCLILESRSEGKELLRLRPLIVPKGLAYCQGCEYINQGEIDSAKKAVFFQCAVGSFVL